jgi:hypothetical protein
MTFDYRRRYALFDLEALRFAALHLSLDLGSRCRPMAAREASRR